MSTTDSDFLIAMCTLGASLISIGVLAWIGSRQKGGRP